MFERAGEHALTYVPRGSNAGNRPFDIVATFNPRKGLRSWVAHTHQSETYREARASVHFDGSVALAFALGGQRSGPESFYEPWEFDAASLTGAVADFMGLVRVVGSGLGSIDYEARIEIVRNGPERMIMHSADRYGWIDPGASMPMHAFTAIEVTIDTSDDEARYLHQVRDIIEDCLNQGGVSVLRGVTPCNCEECSA